MPIARWLLILALTLPLSAQQKPRVVTPGFIALNSAGLGLAALDVTLTQRCIRAGTCVEANPLMQGSAGRQYGIALGMAAAGTFVSYEAKKHGSKAWMVTPIISIGAHGFGVGTALRF